MRLYVNVKQAGVRRYAIEKKALDLEFKPMTLRELVAAIVTQNVANYNNKIDHKDILNYLTAENINEGLTVGKVGFGEIYNDKKASLNKALESAFLAYEDGIYRVFVGEVEAGTLDEFLEIKEEDVLTFVRLTMLSGRMW